MDNGSKVEFMGCSKEQKKWGSHDGDSSILNKGEIYIIERIEVHNWHSKLFFKDIEGSFNSVCFKEIK